MCGVGVGGCHFEILTSEAVDHKSRFRKLTAERAKHGHCFSTITSFQPSPAGGMCCASPLCALV